VKKINLYILFLQKTFCTSFSKKIFFFKKNFMAPVAPKVDAMAPMAPRDRG
jgi:hypothetical protein